MAATFSEIYLRPSVLQDDSKRMRAQLAAAYLNFIGSSYRVDVKEYIQQHSGIIPESSKLYEPLDVHFNEGNLIDVLDSITAIADWFVHKDDDVSRGEWIAEIQRIFDQQHVKYAIDPEGSVRLRVDAAFEFDREAMLAGLQSARYGGVRTEFEGAYSALSATQVNGKQAIRGIFEACEVTFKLMFPSARRIGAPEIGANLMPFVERHYASDAPAQEAAKKLVQGFTDWVVSAQFYRHGQGQEDPNQPPLELAIAVLSSGTSYLRWLIHLDQAQLVA